MKAQRVRCSQQRRLLQVTTRATSSLELPRHSCCGQSRDLTVDQPDNAERLKLQVISITARVLPVQYVEDIGKQRNSSASNIKEPCCAEIEAVVRRQAARIELAESARNVYKNRSWCCYDRVHPKERGRICPA